MTGPVKGNLGSVQGVGREEFSQILRTRMHDRRLSVTRLSVKTGIGERLLRLYRKGQSWPVDWFGCPTPHALALCDALDCTLEDLGLPAACGAGTTEAAA